MNFKKYPIKCLRCGNDTFDMKWDEDHAVYKCENCYTFFDDGNEHSPVMNELTISRKADGLKRIMFNLTAYAKDLSVVEKLKSTIESMDIEKVLIKTCPDFNEWLAALPTKSISGLADDCYSEVHHWSNGGSDFGTETMMQAAIMKLKSDVPKDLADTMYNSIVDYYKTPFEASVLVMDIMNECLDESRENTPQIQIPDGIMEDYK